MWYQLQLISLSLFPELCKYVFVPILHTAEEAHCAQPANAHFPPLALIGRLRSRGQSCALIGRAVITSLTARQHQPAAHCFTPTPGQDALCPHIIFPHIITTFIIIIHLCPTSPPSPSLSSCSIFWTLSGNEIGWFRLSLDHQPSLQIIRVWEKIWSWKTKSSWWLFIPSKSPVHMPPKMCIWLCLSQD